MLSLKYVTEKLCIFLLTALTNGSHTILLPKDACMTKTTRPKPAVYREDDSYHMILDDHLIMHVSEKQRDAHLAAYAKGQIHVLPTYFINNTADDQHAAGFTACLDENFSLTYDADNDIAAIHDSNTNIWASSDFARWLMPILEARGFKRQQTTGSARKIIYGGAAVVIILACTVILAVLGYTEPGICAQDASLLKQKFASGYTTNWVCS